MSEQSAASGNCGAYSCNTTILVEMLFCCVVVVVSCCLFVVDYQMLWEMVVCTLR